MSNADLEGGLMWASDISRKGEGSKTTNDFCIMALADEVHRLRRSLAAAEKERDAYKSGMEENGQSLHDALQKLSLYESAPSELALDEALAMCEAPYCGAEGCYEGRICDRCKAENVLAASYRACQAKLAEAERRIPEQEISDARLMAEKHEDRALIANRRAAKAESELAAARAKIEDLQKVAWYCGCGHTNAITLSTCAACGRKPGEN